MDLVAYLKGFDKKLYVKYIDCRRRSKSKNYFAADTKKGRVRLYGGRKWATSTSTAQQTAIRFGHQRYEDGQNIGPGST